MIKAKEHPIKTRFTLREVARQAGVSVATVSRVLNNSDKVVPETRDKIKAVMDRLGYLPNPTARNLNTGRTMTIGAIVPTLDHAIFARFLESLEGRVAENGYALVVSTSDWNAETEAQKARTMLDMGAEALVVTGVTHSEDFKSLIRLYNVPLVQTSYFDKAAEFPTIGYDNAKVATLAYSHLAELGHRHIAVIHGATQNNDRTLARLDGLRALPQADTISFIETSLDVHGGRKATQVALAANPKVTALLCLSDLLAVGALFELQSQGLLVPDDMSVMGFDNLQIGESTNPPLSTVRLRVREMAQLSADALCAHLSDASKINSYELSGEIIQRGSVRRRQE